jgi:ASTRA-associated protein 1
MKSPLTIFSHGRDHKLNVWQIKAEDESSFSTVLPIDDAILERKQPWLLHTLTVNSLNFCSFTLMQGISLNDNTAASPATSESVLVAVPGVQDGMINVVQLPSEDRIATIPTPKDVKTGMIMAIGLCYFQNNLIVLAGYESGHAAVWQRDSTNHWQTTFVNKAHSQPILSLDSSVEMRCFFTSSADAIIARHPLPSGKAEPKTIQTKHAGQQGLTIRSDQKILATAGWDGRARVYSTKSMKELAVLKWHKEGCYAIGFADISNTSSARNEDATGNENVVNRTLTVSEQRLARAKEMHWLAVGSKDGKVSLWNIY